MTQSNCVPGFLIDDDPPPPTAPARAVKPKPDDALTPNVSPANHSLLTNFEFLADCSRYLEGIYTRAQVKKRWRDIDDATWDLLGDDNELVDAIELERTRRIRDGSAKREKAQQLIVKGPEILDGIATNPKANDKHKIDAIKALDGLTGTPAQAEQKDRVIVTIRLGKDEPPLVINAAVKTDPNIIDHTPPELPPPRRAITDYSDE